MTRDRYKGSLLGLAVGDALGAAVEFFKPGSFKPVTGMQGNGPHRLPPGYWTDDTSMALCLAESLLEKREFDPLDQMQRYVRWYREGHRSSTGRCFDIGTTTRVALTKFENTRDPYAGPTEPNTAGNGSLMRLAPVPLFYGGLPREALDYAALSSRTTHGAVEAVDACRYYAALIWGALHGRDKDELLLGCFEPYPGAWREGPLCPGVARVAAGSYRHKQPPDIKGTSYVVECLEAALWAFHTTNDFASGALAAVNLGDDADTTGAVYGQLGGAYYGVDSIPAEWLDQLAHRELIESYAARLHAAALERRTTDEEPTHQLTPTSANPAEAKKTPSSQVSEQNS